MSGGGLGKGTVPGYKGKVMAYTDLAGRIGETKREEGALRRFLATFFAARSERTATGPEPRKLAGPVPGDIRARGYLDDLDIEVGF